MEEKQNIQLIQTIFLFIHVGIVEKNTATNAAMATAQLALNAVLQVIRIMIKFIQIELL